MHNLDNYVKNKLTISGDNMNNNEYGQINFIARKKILVSRVILGKEDAKVAGRFGLTFDCFFNLDHIKLAYTRVGKLLENYEEIISYVDVKEIEFSIARRPIRSLHEHTGYITLDIIIRLKDDVGGESYHLETFAFALLKQIVEITNQHKIDVIDPMNLVDKYAGIDIEVVKDLINPIYNDLAKQFNLVNQRTLDDR